MCDRGVGKGKEKSTEAQEGSGSEQTPEQAGCGSRQAVNVALTRVQVDEASLGKERCRPERKKLEGDVAEEAFTRLSQQGHEAINVGMVVLMATGKKED